MTPENSPDGQTLIGGRYALGELLGRGGMAEVRKGTDARLGRVVAVKRLRTDLASDVTFQARFRREAQSSASLNHPAIVAVYDTGEEQATDGSGVSQPYIVMEYVAGRTLRDILREGRKILPERALEITSGVLSALDYSHRAGIIHRDIKPGNVMLTPSGDVKVMDFGIARAMSDASSTMTQTAAVVGTAQYLSPEQARGEPVDSRSDVYSAGCLLYELLTGRPPFVGDSPVAVAYQHVREPAAPPSDHDTEVTPEVDAIVMKALAKRVEDRYQSAAAMRSDIERSLAGHPVRVVLPPPLVPPPAVTDPTTVVSPVPLPVDEAEEDDRGTRPGLLIFLALLLLVVLGLAAYLLPKMFASPNDTVPVPDLSGMTEQKARATLGDAGLAVGTVNHAFDNSVKANRVITPGPRGRPVGRLGDAGRLHALARAPPDPGPTPDRAVPATGGQRAHGRPSRRRLPTGRLRSAEGHGRQHQPARQRPGGAGVVGHRVRVEGSTEGSRRRRPAAERRRERPAGEGLRAGPGHFGVRQASR